MTSRSSERETWKPVAGFEGYYEVSDRGRVRSCTRTVTMRNGVPRPIKGRVLSQASFNGKGHYKAVTLSRGGKQTHAGVHRLVAEAFVQNPMNYPEVNHKDEDKSNNSAENLEWCDRRYNNTYGTAKVRAAVTQGKPVLQLKDGRIINAWPSEGLAAQFTGASQSGISACCRVEMKTSGGFGWMWAPWDGR
ncbi:NUMOD4 motif-containing HNH endonuclease [Collinsella intestinalis]|uniref:NUMOD4 motif-containing HNH endonuclease n=1 Tax=Collinsella intestinalis TaxID=147207 RepID=UPI0025A34B9A|nr:NUMOD4 motif-containing HNH endonuclease [Collinsella intestinalis]MDM8162442.1 NUMOD4 motif-containing HNH endonuclease [Collinsella intestinalis]